MLWEHRQHAVAFNARMAVWVCVHTAPRLAAVLRPSPAAMHCQSASDGQLDQQQAFPTALFTHTMCSKPTCEGEGGPLAATAQVLMR